MSALVAQPAWRPAPVRPVRPVRRAPRAAGARAHLQVVGPGFVPVPAPVAARPAPPAPLRLTALGRGVVAALALVAAAAVAVGLGSVAGAAVAGPPAQDVATVTVAAGDTLWAVASEVAGPGEDVRDVVATIAALNDLGDHQLRAGQQLLVPAR
ncbi:LysM peptidoglycan-binding domain-containing protein [Georgenia ruanii]|nr:LysM peptidoglycan-binding domain-containing protein [Georgenia ruanii]